jgi:hypothetical protein
MKYLLTEQQLDLLSFSQELNKLRFTDEEVNFILSQINKSDLKYIYFESFINTIGFAYDNETIIFDKNKLRRMNKLDILFIIFHELSHLLQYKKYGNDFALNVYVGKDLDYVVDELIKIESVADRLAMRMLNSFKQKFPQDHIFNTNILDRYKDRVNMIKYLEYIRNLIKKNQLTSIIDINDFILNNV